MDKTWRAARLAAAACVPLLTQFAIAGCGGGHSGSSAVPTQPSGTSSAAPRSPAGGNVSFSFAIPRGKHGSTHARRTSFISPGAASVNVTINGVQSSTSNVGANLPGCTANGSTEIDCTVSAQAPNGFDSFDVKLFDGAGGSGQFPTLLEHLAVVVGAEQELAHDRNRRVAVG